MRAGWQETPGRYSNGHQIRLASDITASTAWAMTKSDDGPWCAYVMGHGQNRRFQKEEEAMKWCERMLVGIIEDAAEKIVEFNLER